MNTKEKEIRIQKLVSHINNMLSNMEIDLDGGEDDITKDKGRLSAIVENKGLRGMMLGEITSQEHMLVLLSDFESKIGYDTIQEKIVKILKGEDDDGEEEEGEEEKEKKREKEESISAEVLHVLYRVPDVSTKTNREKVLNKKEGELKKALKQSDPSFQFEKIKIHYICDTSFDEDEIFLDNVNRFNLLKMPQIDSCINFYRGEKEEKKKESIEGYVMSIQLKQLIEIYNKLGDVLFKRNVRYGLQETFGVDTSIKNTLKNNPERFWFLNNGITIIIEDSDFRLDKSSKITLYTRRKNKGKIGFSVINGAQTITASAEYYYKLKNEKQTEEVKNDLKRFEDVMVLLRLIHIKGEDETESNKVKLINEVSVSLNRQKPIKAEDIAYTAPQVVDLLNYMEQHAQDCEFFLEKRGEISRERGISLIDMARAKKAIVGKPGDARSESAKNLLKQDIDTRRLKDEEVFCNIYQKDEEIVDKNAFDREYKWIYFANSVARLYAKECERNGKQFVSDEEKTILNNGKWYFVAYFVNYLSQIKEIDEKKEKRNELLTTLQEEDEEGDKTYLGKLVIKFVEHVAEIAEKNEITDISSNTFKNNNLYGKLIDAKGNIFSSVISSIRESNESWRVRITKVEVLGETDIHEVKNTKEAFQWSITYLGEKYPDIEPILKNIKWITRTKQHNRSVSIQWGREKVFLNTNAGTVVMKKRLEKILSVLKMEKDSIRWYEEGSNEPYENAQK